LDDDLPAGRAHGGSTDGAVGPHSGQHDREEAGTIDTGRAREERIDGGAARVLRRRVVEADAITVTCSLHDHVSTTRRQGTRARHDRYVVGRFDGVNRVHPIESLGQERRER
jgi:hypothetical protein